MIIEVIVGDVGKDEAVDVQSGGAMLFGSMRADLHKTIFAAGIGHLTQVGIDL